MNRTLLTMTTALLLALPALAQDAGQNIRNAPSLTVNGNGEARVRPDEATVRLGVTRQAASAQRAQALVNETAQKILDAITRLGVKAEQIQTSQLTLFPVYAPQAPERAEEPRIVAYRASNIVSVRLEDLNLVGRVIDAGLEAGANQLEGVQFGLRNDREARETAMREAVREARQKARVLTESFEVSLGGILEIQEGGVSIQPPPFAGGAMFAREAASTPVSPGEVTVNASVTVRYRIVQR